MPLGFKITSTKIQRIALVNWWSIEWKDIDTWNWEGRIDFSGVDIQGTNLRRRICIKTKSNIIRYINGFPRIKNIAKALEKNVGSSGDKPQSDVCRSYEII